MTPFRTAALFALLVPAVVGCAGRAAPFNELDKAQVTVMRLQGQDAAPTGPQAQLPMLIPGMPPEWAQMGQQALQGLSQMLPPGLIPPGLIPGAPAQQNTQNLPRFKNFVVLAQMPMTDDETKEELLDIFGHESNFQNEKGSCFTPGLGISMARGSQAPVDLLISIGCNQAMGDGFKWPYAANGFTPDTRQRLTHVYEKMWGPVPPGA